jgi:hypothetical protein
MNCTSRFIILTSPNIKVIKGRRIRCAGHVERMGEMRNVYTILSGNLNDTDLG